MQKLDNLKNTIENEMLAIDKEYERVNDEATKSYKIKREKLDKEEEDLKDKLKNEVTKIKETLENNLSKVNNLFKSCEKIKKGIKSLEKEEKYILQTLSYISSINKSKIEINSLIYSEMINLKIAFNEKESDIEFDKYYFNGDKIKNFDNNIDIENEILAIKEKQIEEIEKVKTIEEIDEVKPIEEIKEEEKTNEQEKLIYKIKKKKIKKKTKFYEPEEPKEEKDNIIEEPKEQINYYNTIEQPKNVINYYFNQTEENKPIENNTDEKQYFPFNFFKKGK